MDNIKVWVQIFFDDGSVTQGMRVDASIYDNEELQKLTEEKLLQSVNRTEGFVVIWGAGDIQYRSILNTEATSSSAESETSA